MIRISINNSMQFAILNFNTYSQQLRQIACSYLMLSLIAFNAEVTAQEVFQFNQNKPISRATSPYLRSHADNPVIWQEWENTVLERARTENKPLIISIGYSACHWCHVMEEETFMDTAVARVMNENFVPVKIDREQRPDLDKIYVEASLKLTGSYGWPLNILATPTGDPFHAVTYQSKEQWLQTLDTYLKLYQEHPERLQQNAAGIAAKIGQFNSNQTNSVINENTYQGVFSRIRSSLDQNNGGFMQMQKFPLPIAWQSIMQYVYYAGDLQASKSVERTLDIMATRAIYDQVGGGFFRYTTDAYWSKPHFEKMLYDNAQLISLFANGYRFYGNERYLEIAQETIDFAVNWLRLDHGGFASAVSASDENENPFYTWSIKALDSALELIENQEDIKNYYKIKPEGNWSQNRNVLYADEYPEQFARRNNLDPGEFANHLNLFRNNLNKIKDERRKPAIDQKVVVSWNGLLITGLVEAYLASNNNEYLQLALTAADFLVTSAMQPSGKLTHTIFNGKMQIESFLEDYAFSAASFIKLYQATFDLQWLERARLITDFAIDHFKNKTHPFFDYAIDSGLPVSIPVDLKDEVVPASNSMMAKVLYELGNYFQDQHYLQLSREMLYAMENRMKSRQPEYGNWWMLMGLFVNQPYEVVITGPAALEKGLALQKRFIPDMLIMGGVNENLPLMKNKLVTDQTIIYICRDKVCKMPVTVIDEALELISDNGQP